MNSKERQQHPLLNQFFADETDQDNLFADMPGTTKTNTLANENNNQTNLMVFGPGRYKFLDVPRYGAGLTLLMTLLVPALILGHYGTT